MNNSVKLEEIDVKEIDVSLETENKSLKNIDNTKDFFNDPIITAYIEKQITEGIQKALKGTPPKANTKSVAEQEIKQFEKMTYKERLNLFKSNPQTYHKLSKGEI